jgi:hypothetical protein
MVNFQVKELFCKFIAQTGHPVSGLDSRAK